MPKTLQLTGNLRWFRLTGLNESVLQQQWMDIHTGEAQWIAVQTFTNESEQSQKSAPANPVALEGNRE